MQHSKPSRVTAGLALLAVTVMTLMVGATAQSMPGHNMASMNAQSDMGMAGSLTDLRGEEFETAFMSAMIAHHQSATEMAQWILERTEDPEITQAAQGIIDEQEAEIAQMTGWLQEWYGQEPDAEMMGMMQEMMAGMMQTMMDAGDPKRAFLEGMSLHHDSAIDMAQLALFRSVNPELRTLAGNIIMAQAEEVVRFQGWLAEQ
jgi:uncharacterized protein (DUF305 family)